MGQEVYFLPLLVYSPNAVANKDPMKHITFFLTQPNSLCPFSFFFSLLFNVESVYLHHLPFPVTFLNFYNYKTFLRLHKSNFFKD
jgi:hypothetical protein